MRGLEKFDMIRGQIYRQIYKLKSQLLEKIGLIADSMKIFKFVAGGQDLPFY